MKFAGHVFDLLSINCEVKLSPLLFFIYLRRWSHWKLLWGEEQASASWIVAIPHVAVFSAFNYCLHLSSVLISEYSALMILLLSQRNQCYLHLVKNYSEFTDKNEFLNVSLSSRNMFPRINFHRPGEFYTVRSPFFRNFCVCTCVCSWEVCQERALSKYYRRTWIDMNNSYPNIVALFVLYDLKKMNLSREVPSPPRQTSEGA